MNQNLDTIVELQDALMQLQDAEGRLSGIPDWMRELHDEHEARKSEIEALDQAAEAATRDRRTAESGVADAQEKLKKYQQQINKVSNQREYGAILQEIDTVKSQISTSEEAAFAALERSEEAARELAAKRESFRELEERYATELARWESEKPGIARHAEELRGRVADLKARVPRNLLSVFERLLARYPVSALAETRLMERPGGRQREWHCTACNYRVRPQVVVEIRNGSGLVQCDSCKRILILPPAEQA